MTMLNEFTLFPQQQIDELVRDNEMLHAENALKLTQILDLEQLLYDLRTTEDRDGSPCWSVGWGDNEYCDDDNHCPSCIKARQVTEMFWKK